MKGFFTQGMVILAQAPIPLAELRPLLPEYPFIQEAPSSGPWEMGGDSAVVAYRPEVNGNVIIDTVPQAWPDHMGSPKAEPMLFGAWSMGHFGPLAFPQGLERAIQHAWSWPQAKTIVPTHCAFVRLRLTYIFQGAGPDAKVRPPDYDPRHELDYLTLLARGILNHPSALAYFNPNGEVLASAQQMDDSLRHHLRHTLPPLDLWANVRLYNLNSTWLMMDSVGNGQLDLPDHEAVFPKGRFETGEVSSFLRNASLYVLTNGEVIKDNDTMDGPGNQRWQACKFDTPITSPPRTVYCWIPLGSKELPTQVTARIGSESTSPPTTPTTPKKWWKIWK